MSRGVRRTFLFAGVGCLLLFVPWPDPSPPAPQGGTPFVWNQDSLWDRLEQRFADLRHRDRSSLKGEIAEGLDETSRSVEALSRQSVAATDTLLKHLERQVFDLAPAVAACPDYAPAFLALTVRLRTALKEQSTRWGLSSPAVRATLYRLLYGSRMAVEEVLLQSPAGTVTPLPPVEDVSSATPEGFLLGVPVHSGDILVSRGGAATSALIARGSDFPGNFSHVALVYVDTVDRRTWIVESHIERGVAIAGVDEYLRDTKLRVMVLRLRPGTPAMDTDPLLPHRAAAWMYAEARRRHIPYDFAMNDRDTTSMFCSEVVSQAYRRERVTLWTGRSHISSPGTAAWLGAFGVRNFETEEPSDLEYDPQLAVVAEWRDPATLFKDHVDNAVIDAMLEEANRGKKLEYSWYALPLARLVKAWSSVLNLFGGEGPVPEGMDAAAALRHTSFDRSHAAIRSEVLSAAARFRMDRGYNPPYWELVRMARAASASPDRR